MNDSTIILLLGFIVSIIAIVTPIIKLNTSYVVTTIVVTKDKMLDSACDKFYWKRIA